MRVGGGGGGGAHQLVRAVAKPVAAAPTNGKASEQTRGDATPGCRLCLCIIGLCVADNQRRVGVERSRGGKQLSPVSSGFSPRLEPQDFITAPSLVGELTENHKG